MCLLSPLAVLVVAVALPGSANATAPSLVSFKVERGYVEASYFGYSQSDPYVVELSTSSQTDRNGAFVSPTFSMNGLGPPNGASLLIWRTPQALLPGSYFLHAAVDRTASYLRQQDAICAVLGCLSTWDGHTYYFDWSPISLVVISPEPAKAPPTSVKLPLEVVDFTVTPRWARAGGLLTAKLTVRSRGGASAVVESVGCKLDGLGAAITSVVRRAVQGSGAVCQWRIDRDVPGLGLTVTGWVTVRANGKTLTRSFRRSVG